MNKETVRIELSGERGKGLFTTVDKNKIEKISGFRWWLSSGGYAFTRKWNSQSKKYDRFRMHRLLINAKKGQIVDHINRNRLDNRMCNLRFVSAKGNAENAQMRYGENQPRSKLTGKQVKEIIAYYSTKDYSTRCLAEMYRVGKTQIHNIVTGKNWCRYLMEHIK